MTATRHRFRVVETRAKRARVTVGVVLVMGCAFSVHAAPPLRQETRRMNLQRHDLSIPGWEVVQVRVDFGSGAVAPPHRHPGEEVIYVLEGTSRYRISGKPAVTARAGDGLTIPAGVIHSAKNVGPGDAAELATYIVQKGKPLVELVK